VIRLFGWNPAGQPAANRSAADFLARAALESVQDLAGRVRVEDYITVLAALTGEAALVAAGVIDIEANALKPGSRIFGDPINVVLSGDGSDLAHLQPNSVAGIMVSELVPSTVPLALFVPLPELYHDVAGSVGTTEWGAVGTTVPADHRPTVLPLRVAFELRPAVVKAETDARLPSGLRYVPCTLALCQGIKQVKTSADNGMVMRLALEVAFGMAKMVPMSRSALESVAGAK
jgi:hypothetical protein